MKNINTLLMCRVKSTSTQIGSIQIYKQILILSYLFVYFLFYSLPSFNP